MITERPLHNLVQLQRIDGPSAISIDHATNVRIRRGGNRSGLGLQTDVGILSFRLYNDEDPMAGGTFQPGQEIQVLAKAVIPAHDIVHPEVPGYWVPQPDIEHPATVVYSQDFSSVTGSNPDGWITASPLTGTASSSRLNISGSGTARTTKTLSGLVVGSTYTFAAQQGLSGLSLSGKRAIGVTGKSETATTGVAGSLSYQFVATATSHALYLETTLGTATSGYWDDITLTRAAWSESQPDAWVPPIPAWSEHVPEAVIDAPIYTGRVVDIDTSYPLNKQTGERRTYTTVTVADSVRVHTTTPRYGVTVPTPGYETFEARIVRLSGSAQAPVVAPTVGGPKEVYAL